MRDFDIVKKYDNITVFVNSCDSRSDAWEPFFRLFDEYWPNHPEKVVLNSETKEYDCDFMKIHTFTPGKGLKWGERFRRAVEKIDTEYIVYFLEDFFLMREVSDDSFKAAVDLMEKDKTVGFIGLKYNKVFNYKKGMNKSEKPFVSKDDLNTLNRINNMSVLWRREWLLQLIKDNESPWEFDRYASIRSKKYPYQVLMINCENGGMEPVFDYGVDIELGYGIYKGKWMPKNKELFEAHGIEVDFENLGWYEDNDNQEEYKVSRILSFLYHIKKKIKERYLRYVNSK